MRSVSESVDYSSEQGVRAVKPNGKGWRKYRGLSSTSTPYHPGECGEWDTEELPLEKTKDEILSRNQDFF